MLYLYVYPYNFIQYKFSNFPFLKMDKIKTGCCLAGAIPVSGKGIFDMALP